MKHQQNQAKAMIEIWSILLRFRWRFIVPAFVVMTMVMTFGMMLPRKYSAEATFDRRTDMVLTEIITRGATQSFQDPRQAIREEVAGGPSLQALRPKLDPLLDQYGTSEHKDRETFYRQLSRRIIITHKHSSREFDRYSVEYVDTNPHIARAIVNMLVENYIERTESMMQDRLSRSAEFFNKEVARYREEIEVHEEKMLSFEIEHDILLPDNPVNVQTLLSERQSQIADLQQQRETATEILNQLTEELTNTPATAPRVMHGPNPQKKSLEADLIATEAKLNNFVGVLKMTEKHPDLLAVRQQIEALRQELENTEDEVVTQTQVSRNPKRDELELRLAEAHAISNSLNTRLKSVQKEVAQLNTQATHLYPVRSDYRRLNNAMDQAKRHMSFWEDNLRRVEMSMAAESGNRGVQLDFIAPCGQLTRPVSPALMQLLTATVVLGILAGALSVFFAYRTDETFVSGEDMARNFNLPLFGAVSELISTQQRRVRRLQNMILYPTSATAMATVILILGGLLYLDLEKPDKLEQLKQDPAGFFERELKRNTNAPTSSAPSNVQKREISESETEEDVTEEKVAFSAMDVLTDATLTSQP